jgi:hypothetical protein
MHSDLNFKLVRIIYTLREKKMYVACSWKLHNLLENNNTKRLNKIEKVNNIMWACQCVNLLLFMMKVWTDLNTALFSSSFRLIEPKISWFSEIISGMSKSEKKSCCFRVVWRGQSNKKWDTVSVIPQIQFGDSTRFLIKRCAFKALQFICSLASNIWPNLHPT